MPIDRRTFMLGSGIAAGGGVLASLRAVAAVGRQGGAVAASAPTPLAAGTDGPSFELRIVGWDRGDGAAWTAIDPQWRGAWH